MAEKASRRKDEIAAWRLGIELGMTLIDTAEMYAGGGAEQLVGEAVAGRRGDVFIVSKVLPSHATRRRTIQACEASLRRLGTDRIDLYLLHWRERDTPVDETLEAFGALVHDGKIRHWGVSNFDVDDMEAIVAMPEGGGAVQTDQVLYNLTRRGIEFDLLPWCRGRRIPVMAYSPIEQGKLASHRTLTRLAAKHDVTPAQVALAWTLRHPDVIAIPKASRLEHVRENRSALDLRLAADDLDELDRAFPPPRRKVPLETI
jgi:diketogulonate reductase-like aldo/keto reductase